jgi:hypothetical protein
MKAQYPLLLLVLFTAAAFTAQQSSPTAELQPELQPELQQALAHDDACFKPASAAASDQALAGSVSTDPVATEPNVSEQVVTEQIRVGGREAGIIAAPQDACDCANGNCSTFVYLKSGDSYKLSLHDRFSSLKRRPCSTGAVATISRRSAPPLRSVKTSACPPLPAIPAKKQPGMSSTR